MKLNKYTVGKRYGKALFELAVENQKDEEFYQDCLVLRSIFQEIPDLGHILSDVRLKSYEKDAIFQKMLEGFSGLFADFLCVVYDYSRIEDLPLMVDEYEWRYNEHHQVIAGKVVTAIPLNSEQLSKLEKAISAKLGYQKAVLVNEVDPTIIGGMLVEANHQVMDGTVKAQLNRLYEQMIE